jgi:ubiquinone/menaquinone biosynthesis C-methylase UbiE
MENKSWPHIDWREVWREMRRARIRPMRITYDKDFEKHFLTDQFEVAQENQFEYGRKVVESVSDLLSFDFEVLEIGPGPGTLTIPLSKRVKRITAMEFCSEMATNLRQKLNKAQINNVEVIEKDWMKFPESELKGRYDLVVCSHFLWQVEDLEAHLAKMESASRKFCAIIQPSVRDAVVREAYEALVSQPYQGQFEPDADIFPYIILRQKGRLLNTKSIEYAIKRDRPRLARYVTSFIGRYIEVDKKVSEAIIDFVGKYLQNDFHIEQSKAVAMWWRIV